MSNFEFLTVLLAIIIGIGITHLMLSIGRFLGEVGRFKVGLVQFVWTVNILLALVGYWWWINGLRGVESWSFPLLLFVFIDIFLWCLLAAALYPATISSDYNLKGHFENKRSSFFLILVALALIDPSVEIALGADNLLDLGWPYLHLMAASFVGGIASIRFNNERFQLAFAIYWGSALVIQTLTFPVLR